MQTHFGCDKVADAGIAGDINSLSRRLLQRLFSESACTHRSSTTVYLTRIRMSPPRDFVSSFVDALPCINPNVAPQATEIPIPPSALITAGFPSQIHVFPGQLEEQRLRSSIQVLSSIVPTICARFRASEDGKFYFALTQFPIPFDTQQSDLDDLFPDTQERVVQETSTSDYLTQPDFIKAIMPNLEGALAAFRLTTFASGKSCLGVSFAHLVADAFSHAYIVQMLSDIYTHGEDWRPDVWPVFDNGHQSAREGPPTPPIEEVPAIYKTAMFFEALPLADMEADGVKKGMAQPQKLVSVLLSRQEIAVLKERCLAELDPRPEFLSSVDVMSGWLASITARGMDEPLTTGSYVFNLRSIGHNPPTFLGDGVLPLEVDTTGLQEPAIKYIAMVAGRCREMINKVKTDSEFVTEWIHYSALALYKSQVEGKQVNYSLPEGNTLFNSYTPFEYAVTFGFPSDQCQTYMGGTYLRIPRMFKANRVSGEREEDRKFQLAFMVPVDKYEKMLDVMEKDRISWRT